MFESIEKKKTNWCEKWGENGALNGTILFYIFDLFPTDCLFICTRYLVKFNLPSAHRVVFDQQFQAIFHFSHIFV